MIYLTLALWPYLLGAVGIGLATGYALGRLNPGRRA
ncbi:hypothetical protein Xaut_3826 [Xanthobacter versatilis]|uniref:Uncharacterized protein n=1 Tax=Xanthobacter autotrophicus (strain ATCC BAA-1158 / Py2) TaxID=78245 RepID=A7IM07_XANP2|nr:hypothetical protein Xaut_3826 [Xanthobacter autotrophicus Py2]